jgi:hypothetical protein
MNEVIDELKKIAKFGILIMLLFWILKWLGGTDFPDQRGIEVYKWLYQGALAWLAGALMAFFWMILTYED